MVRSQINTQKSIRRGRLVFHLNTELFISKIFENVTWLILLVLPVLPLMNKSNKTTFATLSFIIPFLTFMLFSLYFMNRLTKICGVNPTFNKFKMIEILKQKYPMFKIDDSGQKIIRCKKKAGLFSWGKEITIIFEEHRMYINSTTLGRDHIKSPFHSIFNTIAMLQINRDFQQNKS